MCCVVIPLVGIFPTETAAAIGHMAIPEAPEISDNPGMLSDAEVYSFNPLLFPVHCLCGGLALGDLSIVW